MSAPPSVPPTAPLETDEDLDALLTAIDDFVPTIPAEVTEYYLRSMGCDIQDERVQNMISLAAQKFISDIANDALQYSRAKKHGSRGKNKETKLVLTTEDLSAALSEYGIPLQKPEYFANNTRAGV